MNFNDGLNWFNLGVTSAKCMELGNNVYWQNVVKPQVYPSDSVFNFVDISAGFVILNFRLTRLTHLLH